MIDKISFQQIKASLDAALADMIARGLNQPKQFDQIRFWVQYTSESKTEDVVVVYDHKNDCESDIFVYRNGRLEFILGQTEFLKDKFWDDVMNECLRFDVSEYKCDG